MDEIEWQKSNMEWIDKSRIFGLMFYYNYSEKELKSNTTKLNIKNILETIINESISVS